MLEGNDMTTIISAIAGLSSGGGAAWLITKFRSERNEKDIHDMVAKMDKVEESVSGMKTHVAQNYVTKADHNRLRLIAYQ